MAKFFLAIVMFALVSVALALPYGQNPYDGYDNYDNFGGFGGSDYYRPDYYNNYNGGYNQYPSNQYPSHHYPSQYPSQYPVHGGGQASASAHASASANSFGR